MFTYEGTYLPNSDDRFNEIYQLIGATDENGNPKVISAKVTYIDQEKRFLSLDFGENVHGWMAGNKCATNDKAKGFLHVGDVIDVEVEGYNSEKETFICNRKRHVASTFAEMKETLKKGDIIKAKIISRMEYGYFIDIGGGNTVLLHNSMILPKKIKQNKYFFEIGQVIDVMITGYNIEYDTFTVSYKDVKVADGMRIGNTFAVVLDENTIEGWRCHLTIDASITGYVIGKKQNAKYEVGDISRVTLIGFKGGNKLFEFI